MGKSQKRVSTTFPTWEGQTDESNYPNEFHFKQYGIDVTAFLGKGWDVTAGFGHNKKGPYYIAEFNQLEANLGYRFVKKPLFSAGLFAGPYAAWKLRDNANGFSGPHMDFRRSMLGWQVGAKFDISHFALKLGFEHTCQPLVHGFTTHTSQVYGRVGYAFNLKKKGR